MADSPGERLRAAILETYTLDAGEMVLLDQVVEVCDALERVNRDVAALDVLTSTGSAGQEVEHPLLKAQRDYSALLARMVEALRLPAPGAAEDEEGESQITHLARKAARARWEKARTDG
ncbi:MAG: hypothetical protein ACLFWH_05265 [Actinomycetota bacterium]